jgi:hypothetical protein
MVRISHSLHNRTAICNYKSLIHLSSGSLEIYTNDYVSVHSPDGFIPNTEFADQTLKGKAVVNFCDEK